MPTTFKRLHDTGGSVAMTLTLASLANGGGRVSTQVDLTDANGLAPEYVEFFYRVRTGTSPTTGKTVEYYAVCGDEDGTPHIDGGVAATDTGYASGDTPLSASARRDQLTMLAAQPVIGTTGVDYYGSFVWYNPPPRISVYAFNDTGSALDSTGGNHYLRYRSVYGDGR
jgi:hypothetical protein